MASAAVPLVTVDHEGGLCVTPEAVAVLGNISEHVAVVVVAGPYRSGKSFLLNCLAGEVDRKVAPVEAPEAPGATFRIGSTVNPCTRGLW